VTPNLPVVKCVFVKKEPLKHRAALEFCLRFGTVSSGIENLPLQGSGDNRVCVRLNSKQFFTRIDNHEAEIQCGLAFRRYCNCALAVRIDRVRPCDWFISERENRAVLATRYVSPYHSISRSVHTQC
jgi:hypothetical protein